MSALAILALPLAWQATWMVFAAFGAATTVWVLLAVPGRLKTADPVGLRAMRWLPDPAAWRLLAGSFVLGVTTTIFWTYAGALVAQGSVGEMPLRVALWIVLGAAGVVGIVAAPILRRAGLRKTYAGATLLVSLSLRVSGVAPRSSELILSAGALFGFAYIMATSQIGAWALTLYTERPSAGFGLAFLVFAVGAVLGPAVGALLVGPLGLGSVFVVAGAVAVIPLLLLPGK